MIEGTVNEVLEAVVVLNVIGPRAQTIHVPVVIDTGFTGDVMLSASVIRALGLKSAGTRKGTLADGRVMNFSVYAAQVSWHRRTLEVVVLESDSSSLMGMGLLAGSRLTMEVVAGGAIKVTPLRRRPK